MEQHQHLKLRTLRGVILAAGESSRMGRPKLILPWENDTILGCTIENARAGGLKNLTVITGAYQEQIAAVAAAKGVTCLHNPAFATGQSSSLRIALQEDEACAGQGVMFILADQPFIKPAVYCALQKAYQKSVAWLVAPQGPGGRRGNPVIVGPELFADMNNLTGDEGARALFARYPQMALLVPVDDEAIYLDIDTMDDYKKLGGMREVSRESTD